MSRLLAYGFGLGMVALVAAPGFGDPGDDSYPLSTYPMFARPRGKPLLSFVEGVTDGEPVRLPPEIVAHNEVMQAAATVKRAVMAGPEALDRLCTRVAEDVAKDPDFARVREVRIVSARFDPVRYFTEGPIPEQRNELYLCAVRR
ncbi:MAG TPA: hypothetical protein VFX59_24465 [Polyangiales bacterium]|nr:hypothetical protein [Polyangiales bacterium]